MRKLLVLPFSKDTRLPRALGRAILWAAVSGILGACESIEAATGIEPTDLSSIQIGAARETVERVLGEPLMSETDGGFKIDSYVYDRGQEPRPYALLFIPLEGALYAAYSGVFLIEGTSCIRTGADPRRNPAVLGSTKCKWRPDIPPERRGFITVTYGADDRVVRVERHKAMQEGLQAFLRAKAEQGHAEAQYRLGLSSVSVAEARKWFCLSANQGNSYAQFRLAGLLEGGTESGEQDQVQAYKWYRLAELHGHPYSNFREILSKQMTPAQIAEADRLVKEWKPDPSACDTGAATSSPMN